MFEPESLTAGNLLLAGAIVFVAGFSHGAVGFGFPMLATPLLAIMLDVRAAIILTLLPTVAVNIPSIVRGGRWTESIGRHWPLAIYIPIGTVIGTRLLLTTDPAPFKLLLAAIILLYLWHPEQRRGALPWLHGHRQAGYALFGLAAGFLAGTVNVMVPLLIIFTMELGLTPLAMVQLFNLCFLTGKLTQLAAFGQLGLVTGELVSSAAPLVLAAIAGLAIGMRVRERIPAEGYRRGLRWILWLFALLLIGQYLVA